MKSLLKNSYYIIRDRLFFSRKVNFLVCGTQKGGTTALAEYLSEHHEICMAKRKEVHFFDKVELPDYSHYHAFFSPKKHHKVLGEATPIYMYWDNAPERIHEYNSQMKLIVVLRNPVDRAYSHWNMTRNRGQEPLSFREAIECEEARCKDKKSEDSRRYSYVDRGHYLEQLERLWSLFPRENILVLKNEDLKNFPQETLNKVCDFIGVSHLDNVQKRDVHSRTYESKISEEDRAYLQAVYADGIKGLEKELGWNCSEWLV